MTFGGKYHKKIPRVLSGILCISVKLRQCRRSWEEETSMEGGLPQIRAWTCLWSIFSMIDVGEPTPLWLVSLLGWWPWVVLGRAGEKGKQARMQLYSMIRVLDLSSHFGFLQ